ncbi:hypothetical protein DMJ13_21760 [halophilic archaeon]|nr:hypothetical protein DMJ13_21760 [halophilic archaeon]
MFPSSASRSITVRLLGVVAIVSLWLGLFVNTVIASNAAVGLSNASRDTLTVPRWLYLATGGAAIGASGLLASVVTDRTFIRKLHDWQKSTPMRTTLRQAAISGIQLLGVIGLIVIVYRGFAGPQIPTVNVAVILVFAGVRAGLTMVIYLVGNVWPALNPWRTIADLLPTFDLQYPRRLDRWPAVIGLLALVWVETVTPINKQPALLATAILVYSFITFTGALLYTPTTWFTNADPLSVAFRFYGQVSPLRWSTDNVTVRPPGFDLADSDIVKTTSDIAFVIALIWELTFSGFVTTGIGATFITTVVSIGLPPLLVYGLLFVGGYALFLGAYWFAAQVARRTGNTYLTPYAVAKTFTPALLAIAAGYHLAHYFGFFVSLLPSFLTAVISPLSPPANPLVLTLPSWFGGLTIAFILFGHILAVWVAHMDAYATFPSRLQAIRSQYPFIIVMIGYTVISLWLVSLETANPAYIG